jgi:hypothetical protein
VPVPPEKVTSIVPVPVLQFGSVSVPFEVTAVGLFMVTELLVCSQPLLSFTVTVCGPAARPVYCFGEAQAA